MHESDGDERRPPESLPKTLLAAPVLLGLLLVHFTLVGLHVVPPNPISMRAQPAISAWVLPYFAQRWELFAPEPAGKSAWIHVRCHVHDEDGEHLTPWLDITTPLIEAHHRNRLGQANRMLRASRPQLAIDRELERKAIKHLDTEPSRRAARILADEAELQFEHGKAHMQRLASAECKRRFAGRGVVIDTVQARQVRSEIPAFGARHDTTSVEGQALTLPPMDYVEVSL